MFLLDCFRKYFATSAHAWESIPQRGTDASKWIMNGKEELATLGAGCYWGTEKFYADNFEKMYPGAVLGSQVGFMSPDKNAIANPTYR